MRTFGFVSLAFIVGLVAGYAVTVLGGITYMEAIDYFDRDGGTSMALFFGLGPIGGIAGGIFAALVTFLRIRHKRRQVAEGVRQPPQRWPIQTRALVAAAWWGIGLWALIEGAYWLIGPMRFDTYEAALAVALVPTIVPIIAAGLAVAFVYWRKAPDDI